MNNVPNEWFAMLQLIFGDPETADIFDATICKAIWHMKNNTPFSVILYGPAGSGKSTVFDILSDAFVSEKNVWFAHDFNPSSGFFGAHGDDVPVFKEFIEAHPVIFAATNKNLYLDRYTSSIIFRTTGQRFTRNVYNEMVNVCHEHAQDIYRYYLTRMGYEEE